MSPRIRRRACWAVLVLVAVAVGIGGFSLAQAPQDEGPPLVGGFYPWEPYTDTGFGGRPGQHWIRPSPCGRWVALHGPARNAEGMLEFDIWEVEPSGALGDRLPSPLPVDHGVFPYAWAWCGERLVFLGGPGWHRLSTIWGSEQPALELAVFDAPTRKVVGKARELAFLLAGDVQGERLAAPRSTEDGDTVAVFRLPGLELIAETPMRREIDENTTRRELVPLGWDGSGSGWYALEYRVTSRRGMRSEVHMLTFWTPDGEVRDLGPIGSVFRPTAEPWHLPVLALLEGNGGVIGLLETGRGPATVRVYGPEGLVRSYDLRPSETLPERLNEVLRAGAYQFITGAPDGRRAVLQERPRGEDGHLPSKVWCVDLADKTAFEVATIPRIDQCFGWLSGDKLIVSVLRPEDANRSDYGVLVVAEPAEQGDER